MGTQNVVNTYFRQYLLLVKLISSQKFCFHKHISIDSKCRETYEKLTLKIETCGKCFESF